MMKHISFFTFTKHLTGNVSAFRIQNNCSSLLKKKNRTVSMRLHVDGDEEKALALPSPTSKQQQFYIEFHELVRLHGQGH